MPSATSPTTDHHPYSHPFLSALESSQEGIDAISDVIYHLETYDVTTIRAGTPMFLLARKIKAMGIKMVMSGEGADETLAGYLYFHKVHQITSSCLRVLPSASECLGLQDAISLFRPV